MRTICLTLLVSAPLFHVAAVDAAEASRLPDCFGAREPLPDIDTRPYIEISIEGKPRLFLLDFGSTKSSVDLTRVKAMTEPYRDGAVTLQKLCWFDETTSVLQHVRTMQHHHIGELLYGVIGTDILSQRIYTLDYRGHAAYRTGKTFCSDDTLRKLDLVPISVAGYYQNASVVTPRAPDNRWNVPLVPIRVAGVSARGLLDSGFDDDEAGTLIINEALLGALHAAKVTLLSGTIGVQMTTCGPGAALRPRQYRLAEGQHVTLGSDARTARPSSLVPRLQVLQADQQANGCGGLLTPWPFPAALIGASYLKEAGLVVLDPFSARVWVHAATR